MEGVKLSIDRIVVDFTGVGWEFFDWFHNTFRRAHQTQMTVRDRGFKYHITAYEKGQYFHVSYYLLFAEKPKRYTLRIECHPGSLLLFKKWLAPIKEHAQQILLVRSDVAYDIPLPLSELFVMSLTGRNMHVGKGTETHYSNEGYQRQVAGYCRVYDKKAQLLSDYGEIIEGHLTRFEIVYAPKGKIPLNSLVQYPPKFNGLYLCSQLVNPELMKPKILERVIGMMSGELEQSQLTGHYRRLIKAEMKNRPTLDFDKVAAEQWEDAVTLPCAVLGGVISKVPIAL